MLQSVIKSTPCIERARKKWTKRKSDACSDDHVFYWFLQKQKIGAKLHIYL